MVSLADIPLCLTVWHQPNCPHCEEFLPRVSAASSRFPGVVIALVDATHNDRLSDLLSVYETPTVIVLRHGHPIRRFNRALDDDELAVVLASMGDGRG